MKNLARFLCLVMLLTVVCGCLSGCTDLVYENSDDYTVGGGEISENITDIEINWISGGVTVSVTDGDTVKLKEDGNPSENKKLRYLIEDGKLTVQFCKNGRLFWDVPSKKLTLELPKKIAENLTKLSFEVVSADVDCAGITADICKANSVSGNVTLTDIMADEFDCETVSGFVEMNGASFDKADFNSVSGDVRLYIDEDMGFEAKLDSVSGDFKSDFAVVTDGDTYSAGDGSAKIDCETVSGDLTINRH